MRVVPLSLVLLLSLVLPAQAETLVFRAAQAGKQTLDQGEGGGNPFASSLIDLLVRPSISLQEVPAELKRMTIAKSREFQTPDVPAKVSATNWSLVPAKPGETRAALVMVVSDYAKSGGAPSLPGAKHDAERMAAALTKSGFATRLVIDADLPGMRAALAQFGRDQANSDVALIYTTGHGVEVGGKIYVVPGDFPIAEGNKALATKALPLTEVAAAPRARLNLIFYGGCRDDPLGN